MLFSPGWRAPIRQGEVLAVFSLGLVLGGTLSAGVVWLASGLAAPVPTTARAALTVLVAAVAAAREAGLVRLPLPQNSRQIPQEVLMHRLRTGSLRFGFEMGTGVRTYVSASSPYVLALGLLLAHLSAPATLLAGVAFGAGRALSAALTYWARSRERDALIAARMTWVKNATALSVLTATTLLLLAA
ncbi:hypothetical protein [Actinomadura harenae]|uniref:Methylamine utilization protein MauF n=1 Tax=Actinomadura harenae TaxID=2483351 RepID=A0A3M2LV85_9ACTN|nr:hypothetical protein [Actinomadura harenae]RMI40810.1 hypothetical protein EBO15_25190 [Actinomadura harenae]